MGEDLVVEDLMAVLTWQPLTWRPLTWRRLTRRQLLGVGGLSGSGAGENVGAQSWAVWCLGGLASIPGRFGAAVLLGGGWTAFGLGGGGEPPPRRCRAARKLGRGNYTRPVPTVGYEFVDT